MCRLEEEVRAGADQHPRPGDVDCPASVSAAARTSSATGPSILFAGVASCPAAWVHILPGKSLLHIAKRR